MSITGVKYHCLPRTNRRPMLWRRPPTISLREAKVALNSLNKQIIILQQIVCLKSIFNIKKLEIYKLYFLLISFP